MKLPYRPGGTVDDSEGECERLLTDGSQYCAAQYDIWIQRCDDPAACFVRVLNQLHRCNLRLLSLYHRCMNGPFGLEGPHDESGSSGFW